MTKAPIPPEEGSHQNALEIPEQGNISEGNMCVNFSERMDNRQSELIQTVHGLREELQTVKADNEQILKTQEELNAILLEICVIRILIEIKVNFLVILKLICIRKMLENLNILSQRQNLFLMKLKIVNKRLKLQVSTMMKRNKVLKRNISIMMKLWENFKILNPQSLMV